ncbi:MAG: hypothetical protein A2015_02330 [Spirochaetes bacterium GWF1_31_7]|nr:MAG: hypothetical protein A2Y30_06180 [Spirochaetes bacterium GWE1_32_154]OHD50752.1 MAG: hypothetical protein A2015_02330 [Spirochaetes bacterium GWF1_31_7]OHD51969.1 MAG: hypothetical protein A2Y29_07215 [Spirochaetes bacterium GWE2_31_10]OHD74509.1 MAG: hypothetical protein A2355_05980 [Spirochaetes bacterium RIFOXYB1_FULL_32_8]HBD95089.1 hypothetical protein [Spirochaetia bacterium]
MKFIKSILFIAVLSSGVLGCVQTSDETPVKTGSLTLQTSILSTKYSVSSGVETLLESTTTTKESAGDNTVLKSITKNAENKIINETIGILNIDKSQSYETISYLDKDKNITTIPSSKISQTMTFSIDVLKSKINPLSMKIYNFKDPATNDKELSAEITYEYSDSQLYKVKQNSFFNGKLAFVNSLLYLKKIKNKTSHAPNFDGIYHADESCRYIDQTNTVGTSKTYISKTLFDADGLPSEEQMDIDGDGTASTLQTVSFYKFTKDSSGKIISREIFTDKALTTHVSNGSIAKITYEYDNEGYLLCTSTYSWSNNDYTINKRKTISYYKNPLPGSEDYRYFFKVEKTSDNGATWELDIDDYGDTVASYEKITKWTETEQEICKYDKDDNVIEKTVTTYELFNYKFNE